MWVRIDDGFLSHDKAEKISDRALGLWVRGLIYCAKNLTDGRLPPKFVRTKTAAGIADELVSRNLWKRTADGGFFVHDFLEWNPSKSEVKKRRDDSKERYQKWLEKQRSNVVQTPFKQEIGKDRLGTARNGTDGLPPKRESEYIYPDPPSPEVKPDLPPPVAAGNRRRMAQMVREIAAEKAVTQ